MFCACRTGTHHHCVSSGTETQQQRKVCHMPCMDLRYQAIRRRQIHKEEKNHEQLKEFADVAADPASPEPRNFC